MPAGYGSDVAAAIIAVLQSDDDADNGLLGSSKCVCCVTPRRLNAMWRYIGDIFSHDLCAASADPQGQQNH